jgi:multisubunit Na+/H+ antiporter MnhB subunit
MIALVQVLSGTLGIVLFFLAFGRGADPAPWIVYLPVIALFSWAGTKLYVRWRYGPGVKVTPSRPQ